MTHQRYDRGVQGPETASTPEDDAQVARSTCLNCAGELTGSYCSQCGQKASTSRLSVRALVADLLEHVSTFDSTVLRTVGELSRRPGEFCRAYIAGRRVPYVSPLRYCATLVAITFLINTAIGFRPASIVRVNASGLQQQLATTLAEVAWRHADVAIFAALPIFAALVLVLFGWRRTNYAETLTLVLYVVGHTFLVTLPIVPLKLIWPPLYFVIRVGAQLAYFSWAALSFYRAPWLSGLIRSVLATGAYYLLVAVMVLLASLPEMIAVVRQARG